MKKFWKRILTPLLALCLTAGLSAPALAYRPAEVGKFAPFTAYGEYTLAVKSDGTVWMAGSVGSETYKTPVQLQGLRNIVAVSAGGYQSAALDADGGVWVWDHVLNGVPQTYAENTADLTPGAKKVMEGAAAVCCGNDAAFAIKTDGTLWAWGVNSTMSNMVGNGGEPFDHNRADPYAIDWTETGHDPGRRIQKEPVQILSNVRAVNAGSEFAMALTNDGALWYWGSANGLPQQDGSVTLDDYTTEKPYDFALSRQREVLGRCIPVPVKIMEGVTSFAAGTTSALAVLEGGSAWAWGLNNYGQCGNGSYKPLTGDASAIGGDPQISLNGEPLSGFGILGSELTPVRVQGVNGVRAVAAGGSPISGGLLGEFPYGLALTSEGALYGWGCCFWGQLTGISGDAAIPETWKKFSYDVQTVPKHVMDGVTAVDAGGAHTLVLKADGTLWGFGDNWNGQLGRAAWDATHPVLKGRVQSAPVQIFSGLLTDQLHEETVTKGSQPIPIPAYQVRENGGGTNYFKLRDIAVLMNGTGSAFDVTWDAALGAVNVTTGRAYTPVGGEFTHTPAGAAIPSSAPLYVDGKLVPCAGYTLSPLPGMAGSNYYKLRDIADAVGFTVDWTAETGVTVRDKSQSGLARYGLTRTALGIQQLMVAYSGDVRSVSVASISVEGRGELAVSELPGTDAFRFLCTADWMHDPANHGKTYTATAKLTVTLPDGSTTEVTDDFPFLLESGS